MKTKPRHRLAIVRSLGLLSGLALLLVVTTGGGIDAQSGVPCHECDVILEFDLGDCINQHDVCPFDAQTCLNQLNQCIDDVDSDYNTCRATCIAGCWGAGGPF